MPSIAFMSGKAEVRVRTMKEMDVTIGDKPMRRGGSKIARKDSLRREDRLSAAPLCCSKEDEDADEGDVVLRKAAKAHDTLKRWSVYWKSSREGGSDD